MESKKIKMTFGIQDHQIARINDERARWNRPDKDIPGTPPDAILIEGFWEQLGREFGWHPFTLALYYMRAESRIDKNTGYRSLWDYLHFNHNLKLLESEVGDLVHFVHKFYPKPDLALQARCDRYEKALKEVADQAKYSPGNSWVDIAYIMKEKALNAITNEALNGEGEKEQPKEIEYMPVHPEDARKPDCPKQFPMHLLNEAKAQSNHSQSLKRLKERGGLSVAEILAIVGNKPWNYYGCLKWEDKLKMLNELLNQKEDKQ
jgi:hypothetical protein